MENNIETVGADSISALKPMNGIASQRAEIDSAPTYKYNRRSIRLPYYDYSKAGCYFITICTQDRLHLFGEIVDGKMVLNDAGKMIHTLWYEIMDDFPNVYLHEFVIMPNHIHGIIEITNNENNLDTVGADSISALQLDCIYTHDLDYNDVKHHWADMESAPTKRNMDLPTIIQSFKRHTTLQYIKMVKNGTCPPFNKRIWQRNYHEHVIRNDVDYERVATYTINNPSTWENDVLSKSYNP